MEAKMGLVLRSVAKIEPQWAKMKPIWGQDKVKMGSRWAKMRPRCAKMKPRWGQHEIRWGQGRPRWGQDRRRSANMGPRIGRRGGRYQNRPDSVIIVSQNVHTEGFFLKTTWKAVVKVVCTNISKKAWHFFFKMLV